MKLIFAAIALTVLLSVPAWALYEPGDAAIALFICSSEQAILDIAHEDERSAVNVKAKIRHYYEVGICGFSAGPRAVTLEKLVYTYHDTRGILSEVWQLRTDDEGEWYSIVVDPRSAATGNIST